jgi:hypothetical protein
MELYALLRVVEPELMVDCLFFAPDLPLLLEILLQLLVVPL